MSSRSQAVLVGVGIAVAAVAYLQAERASDARPDALRPQTSHAQTPSVASVPSAVSAQRALLDKYCVTCHNERLRTAGLQLDNVDLERISAAAEVWEKVVQKLRSGTMPPTGRPRPEPAASDALAMWLETALDRAAADAPNPGRPAIHRLNRVEYTNAVRDLLAVDVDSRSLLPTDESGGQGFDNNADVLAFSPSLLERYMSAARKISRLAMGDPTIRPFTEMITVSKLYSQEDRVSEDLPFGSRGGAVIRRYFPLDAEYVLKIRLRRSFTTMIPIGVEDREQLDVRLDGRRVKVFTIGGECAGSSDPRCRRPVNRTASPSEYERTLDDRLEVRLPVKAGMRVIGISFRKTTAAAAEGARPARSPAALSESGSVDQMTVDHVLIEGPLVAKVPEETPSRRRIFVCRPTGSQDEDRCATNILSTLARRAYRRPVTDRELDTLLGFYRSGRSTEGFEAGIQYALEGLLVSPRFLVRTERDPANGAPGVASRISDLELASRLSFFLWSSIPDDELLDVAARGQLKDPKVLEQQVRRMLGDPRASALVSNFGGQWLYLRNMRVVTPDPREFPEFDDTLREAFLRETEMFLESQMREDRSVLDLLRANYTFLNEPLARFYGVPNVYGSHFRRVTLTDDRRAGLLGHGSILTVTSYANRTSPVLRGKWLLENFLGAPPPPPPPDVPALKENGQAGQAPTTVRARLEEHRKNPVCASCHSKMDPLGFALENFNGIGKWRTRDANTPIDAMGVFLDGTTFNGPVELRTAILNHRAAFVGTFTEKLLAYAIGRGSEYYDRPAVRRIVREAAPADFSWSSVILGIVKSMPFQMRRSPASPPSATVAARP